MMFKGGGGGGGGGLIVGVPSFSMTDHEIAFSFCFDLPWAQTPSSPQVCYSQPACL